MSIALASAPHELDRLAHDLALADEGETERIGAVVARARAEGVYPASIGRVYRTLAAGAIPPLTAPAFNLRGLTYDLARAIWRAVAGEVIFDSGSVHATPAERATLPLPPASAS